MIISRQFVDDINKDKLAELATQYGNEFVNKLGNQTRVKILPQQLIYDPLEAKRFFLSKLEPDEKDPKIVRRFSKVLYKEVKEDINRGKGLVRDQVAYIPIKELTEEERRLVSRIASEKNVIKNSIRYFFDWLLRKKLPFVSLGGFGAELGHLIGWQLYGQKVSNGFDETIDIFSQLFESSYDIRTICESFSKNPAQFDHLEKEQINRITSGFRDNLILYETFLFEGKAATEQKLIEIGVCEDKSEVKLGLYVVKRRYVTTRHFEGIKLFFEIYNGENCNLDDAYKKLNYILCNPKVRTIVDALRELGYSDTQLIKYKDVFGRDMIEKAKRIRFDK